LKTYSPNPLRKIAPIGKGPGLRYRRPGSIELNIRVELLRDVFVWAYERSCQRYMAICKAATDLANFISR
jgi:hypothetical protein